jgi:pimeloyl-ACP methyl ester carboxylesterase
MPDATLEIVPGAGHAPWLDDLDLCAKATASFLG